MIGLALCIAAKSSGTRRAESPSPIPVWLWVLSLIIVAWSTWYVAVLWQPPAPYAETPTYVHGTFWQHH